MIVRRTRTVAAGVAAALAGLGLGELVAGVFIPAASPLASVGAWAIDLAPSWAKQLMIEWFGTGDKPALLVLLTIGVAALGVAAAALQVWKAPWGISLAGLIGLLGVLAAATRPDAGLLSAVPAALGTVATALLVDRLTRPLVRPDADTASPETATSRPLGRRGFLWASAGLAAAGALAVAGGQLVGASARRARDAIASVVLPRPAAPLPPPASAASFEIDGLAPLITPNDDFYRIDTALVVPQLDPSQWSLRITGMVEREIEIGWDELLALPLRETRATLVCVSNEVGGDLISTAAWLGYPIRDLLARAVPLADADMVLSRSSDGFTAGTPIEAMTDERDAIVAVGMNGAPLPPEHGFPARLVVPGLYGYVSATKWVVELEVTRFDRASAYWTDRGWGERGPIKLSSRIDVARGESGDALLAGVAWAPQTGIGRVEVQIDGGAWQEATLAESAGIDVWRQWRFTAPLDSGRHTARVRATDSDGQLQIDAEQGVLPDGATGVHTVTFAV